MTTLPEDEDDKPLDPAVERVRRKLMRFVVINLGLLFLALMAVVLAIVYRTVSAPERQEAGGEPLLSELVMPQGSEIIDRAIAGDRLLLTLRAADGSQAMHVYDIATGRQLARFDIRFSGQ